MLAEIDCTLSDTVNLLGPMKVFAYLAEADAAPALLGVSGFIQHGQLLVHASANNAYIEM